MAHSPGTYSALYYRLRLVQRVLQLLASFSVVSYEVFEHGVLASSIALQALISELLVYAMIGHTTTG